MTEARDWSVLRDDRRRRLRIAIADCSSGYETIRVCEPKPWRGPQTSLRAAGQDHLLALVEKKRAESWDRMRAEIEAKELEYESNPDNPGSWAALVRIGKTEPLLLNVIEGAD